jgi:hypothetical protein
MDRQVEAMVEKTAFKVRKERFFLYGRPRWNGRALQLKLEHPSGKKIESNLNNLYTWSFFRNGSWTDMKLYGKEVKMPSKVVPKMEEQDKQAVAKLFKKGWTSERVRARYKKYTRQQIAGR